LSRYVWFFIGWYKDDWFMNQAYLTEDRIECTRAQMMEAAEGHFTTEALQWNQNRAERTASGITVDEVSGLIALYPSYLPSSVRAEVEGEDKGDGDWRVCRWDVQCSAVQCSAVQCSAVQHSAVQHRAVK
jgi:hypothetical protein